MSCSPIALAVLSSSLPAFAAAAGQRELRFLRRARPLRPTDPPQSEPGKEWVAIRSAQHTTRREVRATLPAFALGFRAVPTPWSPYQQLSQNQSSNQSLQVTHFVLWKL
ncbi:hypothetical protein MHUMG1_01280 [Metarhizium humberi]|uniref:Secreted protein n=1 Tax=Metarhizium humberi TaxID=2596975 RepID=A0A9P8SA09_9HYPO|nr:hypothetical protein MHUMG1_01280 [Metarhizium humberi]